MSTKKLSDLLIFNTLGMWEFETVKLEDDCLLIQAHEGYPHFFRAEIVFMGVEYIACPIYFFDTRLRLATTQETPLVEQYRGVTVYCFEETLPHVGLAEKLETFFIAAKSLEITIHYGGENLDARLGLSDSDEKNIHNLRE